MRVAVETAVAAGRPLVPPIVATTAPRAPLRSCPPLVRQAAARAPRAPAATAGATLAAPSGARSWRGFAKRRPRGPLTAASTTCPAPCRDNQPAMAVPSAPTERARWLGPRQQPATVMARAPILARTTRRPPRACALHRKTTIPESSMPTWTSIALPEPGTVLAWPTASPALPAAYRIEEPEPRPRRHATTVLPLASTAIVTSRASADPGNSRGRPNRPDAGLTLTATRPWKSIHATTAAPSAATPTAGRLIPAPLTRTPARSAACAGAASTSKTTRTRPHRFIAAGGVLAAPSVADARPAGARSFSAPRCPRPGGPQWTHDPFQT